MTSGPPTWRSHAWPVAGVVLVLLLLVTATVGVAGPLAGWVGPVVPVLVTGGVVRWAQVRTRAQRERYADELAAWATERAAQAERLRIAGELHDLVSHGLGLITVRAAAARSVAGPGGEAERAQALDDIERVGRRTTAELRRMLGVLRTPGAAPLRPPDTLDDLPGIAGAAAEAGVMVTLDVDDPGTVTPGVQLVACAVVREALNNTIRHAGPTRARASVRRDRDDVVVDVTDAGPRPGWRIQQPGAGHGLDGLRTRLTALGGTLSARREDGGFRVTARIPDPE